MTYFVALSEMTLYFQKRQKEGEFKHFVCQLFVESDFIFMYYDTKDIKRDWFIYARRREKWAKRRTTSTK